MESDRDKALRMIRVSQDRLAPVYAPLAEHLIEALALEDRQGIGIDIGSGPGSLIIELAKRSDLHWINADINPCFFTHFFQQVETHQLAGCASAVMADVHNLPFRDDYADVVVSRGSFWLWSDKVLAFKEILRVLKPGGVAYIGRGLSENLPLETAKRVRGKSGGPRYDIDETVEELNAVMRALTIEDYTVIRPRQDNPLHVNYGVWVKFHKAVRP
jgi:ubiquinone/menaquinone biosynthesis C-methylase UbiE